MKSASAALAAALLAGCSHAPISLTVSAAASLQDSMPPIGRLYEAAHRDVKLVFNYGASGTLAEQIRNGAPADVFLSAGTGPMDKLVAADLVNRPQPLLYNTVVLVAPKDSAKPASFSDLSDPAVRLLAIGDPSSVPAGDYARQSLEHLGLMDAVRPKLVLAKDVRQVLAYVESGNADAGIVYATDARTSQRVRVVATAPPDSHKPVVYPAAVVKASAHTTEAHVFLQFLSSPEAVRVFTEHGFTTALP